jgi:hypothetical protein
MEEAIQQAHVNGIELAVSNPWFELWLILHFRDHGAWLDNNQARRLRRQLDGSGDKGLDAASYMPLTAEAARRRLTSNGHGRDVSSGRCAGSPHRVRANLGQRRPSRGYFTRLRTPA